MTGTREGPRITVSHSCDGCKYEESECYVHQSDSGVNVYCTHPEVGRRRVGDTSWDTPTWCPYRTTSMQRAFDSTPEELGQAAVTFARGRADGRRGHPPSELTPAYLAGYKEGQDT